MGNDKHFSDNLANWNDRVPIHVRGELYDLDAFRSDSARLSSIVEFDRRYLPDIEGKTLLHLQCHIGTDTLSWAKLGAEVTGLDFSPLALDIARALAADLGLEARFIEGNVYDAPDLVDTTFDIVYTGVGAICWLPDIDHWASVVAALTDPGGTFYIKEGHPMLWALDDEIEDGSLRVAYPYFETIEPMSFDFDETYGGEGKVQSSITHEWNHGIGEIVTALIEHGFRIDVLEEHRELDWMALPHMIQKDDVWVLPDDQRDLVPLMYSIRATRV